MLKFNIENIILAAIVVPEEIVGAKCILGRWLTFRAPIFEQKLIAAPLNGVGNVNSSGIVLIFHYFSYNHMVFRPSTKGEKNYTINKRDEKCLIIDHH